MVAQINRNNGSQKRILTFVYGTLLAGEKNHKYLAGASFLKRARTRPEFTLYSLAWFPGLVREGKAAIDGEVYEVNEKILAKLDSLEGHPSFYRRTKIKLEDGMTVETYLLRPDQVEGRPIIASGNWRER